MAKIGLTVGQKYRIHHRSQSQKYTRVSVMVFLGTTESDKQILFDARPVAGTQTMPREWVQGIWPTSEPISINERAR
jgi:hypothetical protein